MALPNDKISIPMVARELGTTENDLGRLCIHPNVNKWSRWKPYIIANKFDGIADSDIKEINFGMTPALISLNQIPRTKDLETSGFIWGQYKRPTGGMLAPYRLSDFRNYNHLAIKSVKSIELRSSTGEEIPITGNYTYPSYRPSYYCRLILESEADVKLHEFTQSGLSVPDLYLTLAIGGNENGFTTNSFLFGQSDKTLGEAISQGTHELWLNLDTYNLADVLTTRENIVIAYLAPKASSKEDLIGANGLSLKFDNTFTSTLYFNDYAVYGDGGQGGNPPLTIAEGTWTWMSSRNPEIQRGGSGYQMTFEMLEYTMESIASGEASLYCYIQEIQREFEVTQIDKIWLNSTTNQIIDTSLILLDIGDLQNPQTGEPYSELHCTFYVNSITYGIGVEFNIQEITLQVS